MYLLKAQTVTTSILYLTQQELTFRVSFLSVHDPYILQYKKSPNPVTPCHTHPSETYCPESRRHTFIFEKEIMVPELYDIVYQGI